MATSIKQMNTALFKASYHLLEASRYLSNVEEFRPEAFKLLQMAHEMSDIIEPEVEKISDDKMKSILDEIINFSKDTE